ncbi:hypothetical protein [Leptothoe spongobia]|uniref:Uncharacterized protein n=1 Tax=Leptothoe spongobia TAU-MAC 1115 TaxID=1967444 RepID=A0A947DHK6_9CYAN|nr:hypothetical protein [Leptothoe spongobia]MBT9317198.1 hypothetical protein [Leptothoe spongobia TAU-MAC 1115]
MGSDVLILTIYFLVVIYVLYQMALSVENTLENKLQVDLNVESLIEQVKLQLDQLSTSQTTSQKITAKVDQLEIEGKKLPPYLSLKVTSHNDPDEEFMVLVDVGPTGKMPLARSIMNLSIAIQNTTNDAQIFIDWDQSSITSGKARRTQRVVRSGIPIGGGLPRAQVLSVINPRESFIGQVTGENCLGLDPETQTLTAKRPLVEMLDVADYILDMMDLNSRLSSGSDDGFIEEVGPTLVYGLRLMIGIRQITYEQKSQTTYLMLPFEFEAILLTDEIAFPPLRWLLKRPRPANARDALSTLLLGRPRL